MNSANQEPESAVVLKAHRIEVRHHALQLEGLPESSRHIDVTITDSLGMTDELEVEVEYGVTELRQDITTEYRASDGLSWVTVEELRAGRLVDFDGWNLTPGDGWNLTPGT